MRMYRQVVLFGNFVNLSKHSNNFVFNSSTVVIFFLFISVEVIIELLIARETLTLVVPSAYSISLILNSFNQKAAEYFFGIPHQLSSFSQ